MLGCDEATEVTPQAEAMLSAHVRAVCEDTEMQERTKRTKRTWCCRFEVWEKLPRCNPIFQLQGATRRKVWRSRRVPSICVSLFVVLFLFVSCPCCFVFRGRKVGHGECWWVMVRHDVRNVRLAQLALEQRKAWRGLTKTVTQEKIMNMMIYIYIYTQSHTIIYDIIICRYFWITKLSFPQEGHWTWTALSKSTRSNYSKGHKSDNLTCKFFEIEKLLFIKQQPHEMNNDACKLHAVEWLKQACIAHPFQLHYTITRRVTVSWKLTSRKGGWLLYLFQVQRSAPSRVRFSVCLPHAATPQQQQEQYEAQAKPDERWRF